MECSDSTPVDRGYQPEYFARKQTLRERYEVDPFSGTSGEGRLKDDRSNQRMLNRRNSMRIKSRESERPGLVIFVEKQKRGQVYSAEEALIWSAGVSYCLWMSQTSKSPLRISRAAQLLVKKVMPQFSYPYSPSSAGSCQLL